MNKTEQAQLLNRCLNQVDRDMVSATFKLMEIETRRRRNLHLFVFGISIFVGALFQIL